MLFEAGPGSVAVNSQGVVHDLPEVVAQDLQPAGTVLLQRFDGGTTCDLTGEPRITYVSYGCPPADTGSDTATPHASNKLAIVGFTELRTCLYRLHVTSPAVCAHESIGRPDADADTTPPSPILCFPGKRAALDRMTEQGRDS